ncbi:signal recognition particle-docking protein FtsY, partial [mine drainage metagenome]
MPERVARRARAQQALYFAVLACVHSRRIAACMIKLFRKQGSAPVAAEAEAMETAPAPSTRNWRERLAGSALTRGLAGVFSRHPRLDDDLLDELETLLLGADVGIAATATLIEDLRKRMRAREFADADALLTALRAALLALLQPVAQPLVIVGARPFVVLMVGVNGAGKTTTIGKLAQRYRNEGRSVMLAAGDTFRAAAVEQLKTWGERNQVPVLAQAQGSDSASVIFDA